MNRKYFVVMVLPLLLHACSNRQMYQAVKNRQKVECESLPRSEYGKCMEQAGESYDTYKRDRDEVNEGQ